MKLGLNGILLAAGLAASTLSPAMAATHAAPPESAISYQGLLSDAGTPFDGLRDFRFRLYDVDTGGTAIATVQAFNVEVIAGVFSTSIDFGDAAWQSNQQFWLEIEVGPADGSQTYEILGRQKLSATPYAMNTRGIVVDANASVAIGSQLPLARLDVQLLSGGAFRVFDFGPGVDTQLVGAWLGDSAGPQVRYQGGGAGYLDIGQDGLGNFVVEQNDVPVMTVNEIGNIAAGPALQLDNPAESDWSIFSGSLGRFGIQDVGAGTRFIIDSVGNVGIGTTTPQSRLDVRFDTGNGIEVTDSSTGTAGIGVHATVGPGTGVRGESTSTSGSNSFGVYGQTASASGWGVYSNGRMGASGTKSFMIDHPLDPMGEYLLHYSSESPEPQNRYNGNAIMNAAGQAVVQLPDYFQSINKDFRYTLTPIGSPGPNLYIAQEVENNAFVIAGGTPGQKVTWEVIAQRNDAFVRQRGAPIEVQKVGPERGRLLMPELYGLSPAEGIHYVEPKRMERTGD